MNALVRALAICTVAFATACFAQDSLGDLARQQRFSKPAQTQQHEITNDDIASSPNSATPKTTSTETRAVDSAQKKEEAPDAAEVQAKIRAQKEKIKALEAKIADDEKKLDEFTCPKTVTCGQRVLLLGTGGGFCSLPSSVYNPYQDWCDQPDKLQADIDATQKQLDSERAILESMQEEARQQGFGNAIYDPD